MLAITGHSIRHVIYAEDRITPYLLIIIEFSDFILNIQRKQKSPCWIPH
jgi:hypothetical protein